MPGVHWGCVLGQPASFKTKQAELLAAAFPEAFCVISVPEVLRAVPDAADAISGGRIVPDEVVDAAVENELAKTKEGTLVLLAGYPATQAQAQRMSSRNGVARFAVALNISDDTARERINQSGGSATAEQRLANYREHTSAVVENLQTTAGLRVIDGAMTEQDVHKQLRALALSPPLVARELVPQVMSEDSKEEGKAACFTVLQMNLLADGLSGNTAKRGGFSLIPPLYLDWTLRSQMLLKALSQAGGGDEQLPDIVALQEADHLDDFWHVQMRALGYEGVARVDESSPCLTAALNEPKFPDSVAVFWRREVFELSGEAAKGVDVKDKDGTLVHKTKMLFLRLRIVATGEHVAVVNCHLDSRKNAAGMAVRAQQSELMLTKLAEFAKSASAIIICGDLNATRGERCHDCILDSDFKFKDVYAQAGYGEHFTSMKIRTGSFKAGVSKYAVDHMFFAGASCLPTHVLSLPQEDAIGSTGLPSPSWPSDHLSLRVRFMIGGKKFLNPLSFEDEAMFSSAGSQTFENGIEPGPEPREKKSALSICRCCGRQ